MDTDDTVDLQHDPLDRAAAAQACRTESSASGTLQLLEVPILSAITPGGDECHLRVLDNVWFSALTAG